MDEMKLANDVIFDAIEKHNLKFTLTEDIISLVRYALHIGYNEGYSKSEKDTDEEFKNIFKPTRP
jgi:hypothetical protein